MKVTGIGGIFFKADHPEKLDQWYEKHLGIGKVFYWNEVDTGVKRYTVWKTLPKTSSMFVGSEKDYIFNYTVDDLDGLLKKLSGQNILTVQASEEDENGKFGYIHDPEGNKIILWQPSETDPGIKPGGLDRVTGMGGIFFTSANVPELKEWYRLQLGFDVTKWGCSFKWIDPRNPDAPPAETAWSPFKDAAYFAPSKKEFMFNYRVKDLTSLLTVLKSEGVEIVGAMEEYPYGKFGRIMDPEGNKMELWEPMD